jgi:hypothetical protein
VYKNKIKNNAKFSVHILDLSLKQPRRNKMGNKGAKGKKKDATVLTEVSPLSGHKRKTTQI